jgi:hypothetical protein
VYYIIIMYVFPLQAKAIYLPPARAAAPRRTYTAVM